MTPVFEKGKYQPLSRVTVAALEDLGYVVNYDGADPWKRTVNRKHRRIQAKNYTAVVTSNRSEPIYDETHRWDSFLDPYTTPSSDLIVTDSFTLRHDTLPAVDALWTKFGNCSNSWIILEKL